MTAANGVITCDSVFAGGMWFRDAEILVRDGRIARIMRSDQDGELAHDVLGSYPDCRLLPGLVDIQVNGGGGNMFSLQRSPDSYREIGAAHGATGTTSICPTIVTGPPEHMLEAISLLADLCEELPSGRARFLGVHIEGPFVDIDKRGGHALEYIRRPDMGLLQEILAAGRGHVLMYTLAPELPGALELVECLVREGVRVSAGHTAASAEQMHDAMRVGLTGVTHVFNGMDPLINRSPGVAGVALGSSLCTGLIGDLLHVSPDTVKVVARAKEQAELYLTTDAVSPLGASQGSFDLYGTKVTVRDGGCYTDEGILAGTATPLLRMVNNMQALGVGEWRAIAMATEVPAAYLGLASDVGGAVAGAYADFVVLSGDTVVDVLVGGVRIT